MAVKVRAVVFPGPGRPPEIRHFPYPEVEPGGVVLRTLISEVCGTDIHLWHGRLSGVPYPIIPGHVSAGVVEETGGTVTDVEGRAITVGDVVTFLDVHGTCHACWYCLVAKAATRCPSRRVYGITYSAEEGLLGGWSEVIYLKPGVHIVRLPDALPAELWIAAGCGMPTALHAVDLAGIRLGESVLVLGAGPVGLNASALASLSGAGWIGVVEPAPNRRDMALRMGAEATFELGPDLGDRVREATHGRGPDVVIEASGVPAAVRTACELVRDGGRCVIVGQYTDNGDVALNPHAHINRKHISIHGCWGTEFSHVFRGVNILERFRERFPWLTMITQRYSLDAVPRALADVEARRVVKAAILPNGPL